MVVCSLILGKILHICNFIKNLLCQSRSNCNFLNFSESMEDVLEGSGYRAFSLCVVIVILFILHFHFYIFKKYAGYKVKKFDQKISTAYGSSLVKFFYGLTDYETLKHEWIENAIPTITISVCKQAICTFSKLNIERT